MTREERILYNKTYYIKYKEEKLPSYREYSLRYYQGHKDTRASYDRIYKQDHRSERAAWKQERKRKYPIFRLASNLRTRLNGALKVKSWKKTTHFAEYIGCTQDELKSHIAKQFYPGMSWKNYGEWEIDHIKPLESATTAEEMYKLFHYSNLHPLWIKDNRSKGGL